MEEKSMAIINLRELFPEYTLDCFIEIPDDEKEAFISALTKEIADVYVEFQRKENNHERKRRRNKANYNLDCDEIENEIIDLPADPFEIYADKLDKQQILDAIAALPETQSKRIYAKFYLGISQVEIARNEGVAESAVNQAIERGLRNLEKKLKNFF
jgi:RNA polymerase sigma-70 factor (ECF subfamily)